jgi:uncharacterized protein YutE (UPF0331/DUF86 family)
MTPAPLDRDQVGSRLRMMREALDQLATLRGATAAELDEDPIKRAAAERLIQVLVDLAIDVNGHVAVARLGKAPDTGRASFAAAAEAGIVSAELAERLAPSAGLRNVLVHRYTDIRTDLVADAIGTVLDGFAEYVRSVASSLQG